MKSFVESRLFNRFWRVAGAVSIRVKVLGIVLSVIVLLGVFVTIQMRIVLNDTLTDDLREQGIALSSHIARQIGDVLVTGDRNELATLLADRKEHYSNENHNTLVEYLVVLNTEAQPISHTYETELPAVLLDATLPEPDTHPVLEMKINQRDVLDFTALIPQEQGIVRLGLAKDRIKQIVNGVTLQLVTVTLAMIAFGFAAAFFLTWILTRPILSLVEATQAVGKGDFTRRVPRWADDELGELAQAFNAMTEALAQADGERQQREQLRVQYINGVINAQEEERKRIARELHDSTSQSLTSLLVGLQNLKAHKNGSDITPPIEELREIVGTTLEEVRTLAWHLRPSILDDLGLVMALRHYIEEYEKRYHLRVDFVTKGLSERLPVEMETAIYRIVQEALTNVARYAQARNVSVLIDRRDDTVRIIVEDDGIGFDPKRLNPNRQSLGLQGIRERARLFDGSLTIESQPGKGTSLFVEIAVSH